jgi:two-component sensor histidine kinase
MAAVIPSTTARHRRRLKSITDSLDDIVTLITRVIPRSDVALVIDGMLFHHRSIQGVRGIPAGDMLAEENESRDAGKRLIALNGPAGIVSGKLAVVSDGLEKHTEFLEHSALILSQAIQKIEVIETTLWKDSSTEFFLREMRHRHRNLLQFICGSLTSLIAPLPELNPQLREKIEQWFDEILFLYTMLEDSPDEENVSILGYFTSLFKQMRLTILNRLGTLSAVYSIDETLEIPRATASLLAILLLELVLNTVKHREIDFLSVEIHIYREGENFILCYSDQNTLQDGKEDPEKKPVSGTMGLEIITQLTARAGGKRLDDGSSVHIFKAGFPLSGKA